MMNTKSNPFTKEEDPFAGVQGTSNHGLPCGVQSPRTGPPVVSVPVDRANEVSEETIKKIKTGFFAALVSGTLTLIFTLMAMQGNDVTGMLDAWALIDVVLIFALAVGIYFKSRAVCSRLTKS